MTLRLVVGLVFPFRLSVGYAAACGLVFPGFGWYVGYAAAGLPSCVPERLRVGSIRSLATLPVPASDLFY